MFTKLSKLTHPILLLFGSLTYMLGVGIARYLGADFRFTTFLLGLLAGLALMVLAFFLDTYFRLPLTPLVEGETLALRIRFRLLLLQSSFATLVVFTTVALLLFFLDMLSLPAGLLFLFAVLFSLAYAVPPLHLSAKGYGEVLLGILIGTLLPAFAFLLQAVDPHRLLPLITFPLTLLTIACLLAGNFYTYAADLKGGRRSLLIQLTWQKAIPIHDLLILVPFLFFAAASFFGLSWGLLWPVFLALPFAGLQIYWLQRIASGAKPVWNFFNALAPSVLGLTIYLLTLSFWIR